jgi:hypothetical protein
MATDVAEFIDPSRPQRSPRTTEADAMDDMTPAERHRERIEAALADYSPDFSSGPAQLLTLAMTEVFGRLVAVDPGFLDLVAEHNRLAYERRDRKARRRAGGKGKKKRKAGKQEEESPGRESG